MEVYQKVHKHPPSKTFTEEQESLIHNYCTYIPLMLLCTLPVASTYLYRENSTFCYVPITRLVMFGQSKLLPAGKQKRSKKHIFGSKLDRQIDIKCYKSSFSSFKSGYNSAVFFHSLLNVSLPSVNKYYDDKIVVYVSSVQLSACSVTKKFCLKKHERYNNIDRLNKINICAQDCNLPPFIW